MTRLPDLFPGLATNGHEITSPATTDYNCIAWAAGDTSAWWEPDAMGLYFWPLGARREMTVDAYAEAFSSLGYEPCERADLERGFEKVALYSRAGGPTHAARQLADGRWTSKLGQLEDIAHANLGGLSGDVYGTPTLILRRPTARIP